MSRSPRGVGRWDGPSAVGVVLGPLPRGRVGDGRGNQTAGVRLRGGVHGRRSHRDARHPGGRVGSGGPRRGAPHRVARQWAGRTGVARMGGAPRPRRRVTVGGRSGDREAPQSARRLRRGLRRGQTHRGCSRRARSGESGACRHHRAARSGGLGVYRRHARRLGRSGVGRSPSLSLRSRRAAGRAARSRWGGGRGRSCRGHAHRGRSDAVVGRHHLRGRSGELGGYHPPRGRSGVAGGRIRGWGDHHPALRRNGWGAHCDQSRHAVGGCYSHRDHIRHDHWSPGRSRHGCSRHCSRHARRDLGRPGQTRGAHSHHARHGRHGRSRQRGRPGACADDHPRSGSVVRAARMAHAHPPRSHGWCGRPSSCLQVTAWHAELLRPHSSPRSRNPCSGPHGRARRRLRPPRRTHGKAPPTVHQWRCRGDCPRRPD